jgi:hypothetical protein
VGLSGVGDETSSRAFVELGEHPACEGLERPADAVLTRQRQCQPRGKQGAENQRGGHAEGGLHGEGECVNQFRQASSARSMASHLSLAKS